MCLPVSSCCLCIRLSVAAKIVAILSVIVSTGTCLIYGTAALLPKPESDIRRMSYVVIAAAAMVKFVLACVMAYGAFLVSFPCLVYGVVALWHKPESDIRRMSYVVIAGAAMVKFVMVCVIAYGAFLKKPKLLYPWLLIAWLYSICLIVLSLCGTILMALQYSRDLETSAEVNTMVSVYFIYAIVLYYFASVVNSRREEMIRDQNTYKGHQLIGHKVLPKTYYA